MPPPTRLVALGDVGAEEVDAADVQADGGDGAHGHLAVVGVDDVGHVGGGAAGRQVGGAAQQHFLAGGGNAVQRHGLARQHHVGLGVELDAGHHLLVADAAARVLVDLLDQRPHGVRAVADDPPGCAPRRGDQFTAHHQQPVVVAVQVGLDDDAAAVFCGGLEALAYLVGGRQPDADAAAVVAVEGLGHDRGAQAFSRTNGTVGTANQFLLRHRQAAVGQDLVGLFLVLRELHRDVAGAAGDGGLDALLVLAVAQLDQALFVQPQPGDVAVLGGLHQRGCRRPERAPLGIADEVGARLGPVPVVGHHAFRAKLGRQQRAQQLQRQFTGLDAFVALGVFVDHGVDAGPPGHAARLAEADVFTGDVLQLDGHVFEHMPQPGALLLFGIVADLGPATQPPHEATGFAEAAAVFLQPGQRGQQAVDEAGAQLRAGPGFQWPQVEQQLDDREVRVQRRADIDVAFFDPQGGLRLAGESDDCASMMPGVRAWPQGFGMILQAAGPDQSPPVAAAS